MPGILKWIVKETKLAHGMASVLVFSPQKNALSITQKKRSVERGASHFMT